MWQRPARMTKTIDDMIKTIGKLYQNGKTSIHDVDEKSNNAIQINYFVYYLVFLFTNIHAAKKLET